MAQRHLDQVHVHPTWEPRIRPEYSEDGRLHRHRLVDLGREVRFTTWEHNTESHQHRLPDGAWTRPRLDLNPPAWSLLPLTARTTYPATHPVPQPPASAVARPRRAHRPTGGRSAKAD
jgi:hypothetical protein